VSVSDPGPRVGHHHSTSMQFGTLLDYEDKRPRDSRAPLRGPTRNAYGILNHGRLCNQAKRAPQVALIVPADAAAARSL